MIDKNTLHMMLEKYKQESKVPASVEELEEYPQQWIPIKSGQTVIGILGIDIVPENNEHPMVAVLKLIFIDYPYRGNFGAVAVPILEELKSNGVGLVEVHANRKLSKWLRRYGKSEPFLFAHLEDIDKLLTNIKETRNGL